MNKTIKVLHIASFIGNIGDCANHTGTEWLRRQYLSYQFNVTQKEIRNFYGKEWLFNSDDFISEANSYDLVIIGGGNYFELWVEHSSTGCSIDLDEEHLSRIHTPILFYALGLDLGMGYSQSTVEKFRHFMDLIAQRNNCFVTLRNDGAMVNMQKLYKNRYPSVRKIPDGGFFTYVPQLKHYEMKPVCKNVLINLAGDMLDIRYPGHDEFLTYDNAIDEFATAINILYNADGTVNFIFVPHIFKDIKIIHDIIAILPDIIRRQNVAVSPYLLGMTGHDYIFSLYEQADLVWANRFHANVCSYALKTNVIGIVNYPQISYLYDDLGSAEYIISNRSGFADQLVEKTQKHFGEPETYMKKQESIMEKIHNEAKAVYDDINLWLDGQMREVL